MVKKIKVVDVTPDEPIQELEQPSEPVSYTHLTLPTIYSV